MICPHQVRPMIGRIPSQVNFQSLNLKSQDFCLCVEIPIKAKRSNAKYIDIPSHERLRIAGLKKVNEFRDGFKILLGMIKIYIKIY